MATGRRTILGLGFGTLFALSPAVALADDGERFGSAGQVVISSDAQVSIERGTTHDYQGSDDYSYTHISVAPAADVFVTDGLSVGGSVKLAAAIDDANSLETLGVGPRVGYGVSLNERLSLHPKLGVSFEATYGEDEVVLLAAGEVFVPLLFHPAEHFFVGLGPQARHELGRWWKNFDHDFGPTTTSFGGQSVVGGYF